MVRGLYTAATGMMNQQQRMDIVSNNLANVNTTGFKKDGVVVESFEDVLTLKVNDNNMNTHIGKMNLGVKTGVVFTDFNQGSFMQTHDPFNIAIQGEGFIGISTLDRNGNIVERYTRDGSFVVNNDGELITKDGHQVMGQNGNIVLGHGDVRIDGTGAIYLNDEYIDSLRLVNFDKEDIIKLGDNLYNAREDAEALEFNGQILQGYLEESNVNTIREMVDMINIMRTYEANQKVIQTIDDTLGKAVNEVGRL
ncbi:flagellar basal-body rod protein FlgG [Natranaerovirga pectinivora]|uniref:Flagellar basal-body rod protein FlgG n=1 Tax=Natranaerovirga pectinivora TaxID=682400 RepID=A0A4R3MKL3_9FIRM|nr:flagellar hook-basal body protein [Natranaerovirga pectinivora]TCT14005.1 flagellar basal-body rod protein FlgG [Natranaerovirga pectinivora]